MVKNKLVSITPFILVIILSCCYYRISKGKNEIKNIERPYTEYLSSLLIVGHYFNVEIEKFNNRKSNAIQSIFQEESECEDDLKNMTIEYAIIDSGNLILGYPKGSIIISGYEFEFDDSLNVSLFGVHELSQDSLTQYFDNFNLDPNKINYPDLNADLELFIVTSTNNFIAHISFSLDVLAGNVTIKDKKCISVQVLE